MSRWNAYWHGPVAAVRLRLLVRGVYALLVLDCLVLMLGHGARYGAGGFNVAHFAWMDAVLPVPTAGAYVGVLLLTAFAGAALLLGGDSRIGRWLLLLLYTASWSMSMLDSYQHHVFLSIVLLAIALLPRESRDRDIGAATGDRTSAWSFSLLACSIALVYVFAAVAKMEPLWWQGHVLRRLVGGAARRGIEGTSASLGIDADAAWAAAAIAVVPIELLLAVCYVVAVRQDVRHRWRRWGLVGAALTVLLHGGAELVDLHIGWFSYYMLLLGAVFLAPERWLVALEGAARTVSARGRSATPQPERAGRRSSAAERSTRTSDHDAAEAAEPPFSTPARRGAGVLASALAIAGILVLLGRWIDLPGATGALALAGLGLVLVTALAPLWTQDPHRRGARRRLRAAAGAALVLWGVLAIAPSRYDFYRFLGGDLRRRGELDEALAAYRRAERHAPRGASRRAQIEELERELGEAGARTVSE